MRAAERGRILQRAAALLEQHQEELIAIESLDAGKPLAAVRRQDMAAVIDTVRYYAGWCDKITGQVIPARPGCVDLHGARAGRRGRGHRAVEFPADDRHVEDRARAGVRLHGRGQAGGAHAAVDAARRRIVSRGRVAAGALNVVCGKGSVVGEALVQHPGVDKVTFTGSPKVGRGIMQGAAGNFKKVTLELGGKSANVIFADANLDSGGARRLHREYSSTPGRCVRRARGFWSSGRYTTRWSQRLAERARSIRVGDPTDPKTTMGPVISAGQMQTVLDYIKIGKAEGASLVTGGSRLGDHGYFVEPTVFANVEHEMRISQEEIFGPVLCVIPFDDEEDALRIANGTAYSLAAGVWSADIGRVHRIAAGLKAGTVWINTYGYTDVRLPWGGSGESGLGREHGDAAIENFTQPKAVWLALDQ